MINFFGASKKISLIYLLASISYVVMCMHLPVSLYALNFGDDALFWNHAINILHGDWLGKFHQSILAKGPGYTFFILMNYLIGTPITFALATCYLFSCIWLCKVLNKAGVSQIFTLMIFFTILFHPQIFPTRIIRDNLYPVQVLLILAGCVGIITDQINISTKKTVFWVGFVFGWFWITREEGLWIIPAILLAFLLKIIASRDVALNLVKVISIASLSALVPILSVASINYYCYGKFEVVDFKSTSFSNALANINRVRVGEEIPYLPSKKEKRLEIYKISPAFRELHDYLEGDNTNDYKKLGCSVFPEYLSHTCNDYSPGWWVWVFRDAVASRGYYDNPTLADEFYKRLNREINEGCDSGKLKCRPFSLPMVGNISDNQLKRAPNSIFNAIKLTFLLKPLEVNGSNSNGGGGLIYGAQKILRFPYTKLSESEDDGYAYQAKKALIYIYRILIPPLFCLGILSWVIASFAIRTFDKTYRNLTIVTTLFWGAYFSRLLLLVLIDLTSFPAINSQYMSAGLILHIIASLLSIYLLNQFLKRK